MKTRTAIQYIAMMLWFVFAVGCEKDGVAVVAPMITSSYPADRAGETGVSINISATFSEDMTPSSINSSTFLIKQGTTPVEGTVTYKDRKAIFIPSSKLTILTYYTAVITIGARNASGKPLAKEYIWAFTTCHPPAVLSTTPGTDAKCVKLDQAITILFNHDLKLSTVNSSTFSLSTGTTVVAGAVTYSATDSSVTITPGAPLLSNTTYTVRIDTGVYNNADMHLEKVYTWSFSTFGPACSVGQACGPLNIDLKSASTYGILAGVGITNSGLSEIHDLNVGISPGFRSSITGFPPAVITNGSIFAADDLAPPGALVTQAQADLTTAYLAAQAATSPAPVVISGDLGGRTLVPGIYSSTSTILLQSGDLTLDGGQAPCDSTSVWIFQVGSALTTVGGGGGNVILINGAKANHVYWQVGSSATIGSGTSFKGTIMALTSITLGSGASIQGRLLARNGAVTLTSGGIVTKP